MGVQLLMKDWHVHVFTSTYAADVTGACSAMFELGGMSILHDPDGCNSTYTTHDEPRWYDSQSLMFCSGLDELTAVLGDDNVLIDDVTQASRDLHPRFIMLCGSSIPHIIAFDYKGVAHLIEQRTGVPVIPVPTNGLDLYTRGVGLALREWIRRFADPSEEKVPGSVNLLGVTPIDFSNRDNVAALRKTFTDAGLTVNGCFAMEDSFDNLAHAYRASVNVCVSSAGLLPAKMMRAKAGTPYVIGLPVGPYMAEQVMQAVRASEKDGRNRNAFGSDTVQQEDILVIGEQVYAQSMADGINHTAFAGENGMRAGALWPDIEEGIDEDDLIARMNHAKITACDPLYRNVLRNPDTRLIPLPHEGYSGRIFRKDMPVFASDRFDLEKFLREA